MLQPMPRRHPLVDLVTDPSRIDELYGLEPVFEPGEASAAAQLRTYAEIQCPSCGEVSGLMIDLTSAERSWIEDCQVCCHPMRIDIEVNNNGELIAVRTQRTE